MSGRSQPYRLKWPLTSTEVENLDDMLERLFRRIHALETAPASTASSSSASVQVAAGFVGRTGLRGPAGRPGPPSASSAAASASKSRVVLTGETRTIADTYDEIHVDYFLVQGTGELVIQGDGVLAII